MEIRPPTFHTSRLDIPLLDMRRTPYLRSGLTGLTQAERARKNCFDSRFCSSSNRAKRCR